MQLQKKNLRILIKPHGEENFDSLLYAILHSIRFEKTKNLKKCEDDELKSVSPNDLFAPLNKKKVDRF